MDGIQLAILAAATEGAKPPNLWGALGCALAYSGAIFATVDAFADYVLARGDSAARRLSPGMSLKFMSKIVAGAITVIAAGLVLALDNNFFALLTLSAGFLVAVGISLGVLLRSTRHARVVETPVRDTPGRAPGQGDSRSSQA